MNKVGDWHLGMIVVIIILVLFGLIFIYAFFMPDSGLMDKAAEVGEGLSEKFLKMSSEQVKAAQAGSVRDTFLRLCSVLAKDSFGGKECYYRYGGVGSSMGDGSISWVGDNLVMRDETGQQSDSCVVKWSPCVVGGKFRVGSTSEDIGTVPASSTGVVLPDIFVPANFVKRYKDGLSGVFPTSIGVSKVEFVKGLKLIFAVGEKGGVEDQGILFINNKGNPCFFVTRSDFGSACDSGSEFLDDDCIGEILKAKFAYLPECSGGV